MPVNHAPSTPSKTAVSEDEWFSEAEAAERLGISKDALRKKRERQTVVGFEYEKHGRQWKYRAVEGAIDVRYRIY